MSKTLDSNVSKYVTQQVMTATPAKLVFMLYEKAIVTLREACNAIDNDEFEARWRANNRAIELVETEIDTLTDTNELANSRIEEMLQRLEIQRKDLLQRYIRMEVALATSQRIIDSIRQTTDALFAGRG